MPGLGRFEAGSSWGEDDREVNPCCSVARKEWPVRRRDPSDTGNQVESTRDFDDGCRRTNTELDEFVERKRGALASPAS